MDLTDKSHANASRAMRVRSFRGDQLGPRRGNRFGQTRIDHFYGQSVLGGVRRRARAHTRSAGKDSVGADRNLRRGPRYLTVPDGAISAAFW